MTPPKLTPRVPAESMWDGLARSIFLAWDCGYSTPRELFRHLGASGVGIPEWLRKEPEMTHLDRVPSKGTRASIIWQAMHDAAPNSEPPGMGEIEAELDAYCNIVVLGTDTDANKRSVLALIRNALAAPRVPGWQPIETAPMDMPVLVGRWRELEGKPREWVFCQAELFYEKGNEFEGEYYEGWFWSCDYDNFDVTESPAYWMPLPQPPASEGETK